MRRTDRSRSGKRQQLLWAGPKQTARCRAVLTRAIVSCARQRWSSLGYSVWRARSYDRPRYGHLSDCSTTPLFLASVVQIIRRQWSAANQSVRYGFPAVDG